MTSASNFMNSSGKPTPRMLPRAYLYFVIGATCAGKGSLLNNMQLFGGASKVGLVQVGKLMRAKYPPEYFKGSAAPEHTQNEAMQMVVDGIKTLSDKPRAIFIDGQPRDKKQLSQIVADYFIDGPYTSKFIHVWASKEERRERINNRFENDYNSKQLSLDRTEGPTQDGINLYEIVSEISISNLPIRHIHSNQFTNYRNLYEDLVGIYL